MKSILTLALCVLSLSAGSAFACNCVNISGNSAYDPVCQQYGYSGMCGDLPNICLAVDTCVNISGNSAYNPVCSQYGASGMCSDLPNICQMVSCQAQ